MFAGISMPELELLSTFGIIKFCLESISRRPGLREVCSVIQDPPYYFSEAFFLSSLFAAVSALLFVRSAGYYLYTYLSNGCFANMGGLQILTRIFQAFGIRAGNGAAMQR